MTVTYTLAYYATEFITAMKSFMIQTPGLTGKHLTRLDRDKGSSLSRPIVSYVCKEIYIVGVTCFRR
jgi:hypothetical protein